MCGIAGLMTADAGQVPADILRRLGDALSHRGPDGRREYQAGGVGLVHTRLAIIDVAGGAQPLLAERGLGQRPCALIANAEIYNDLDLRAAMPDARFATGSDCESALHVYLRHGHRFADRLRGMYAIAIHDPAYAGGRSYLVLARDPFGIKPLYYAETARGFAFASEPRALVDAGLVAPVLRREGRDELLALQFTTGRDTPFVGIHRVLPGETLVVEKGRIVNRLRRDALPAGGPAGWNADEAERRLAAALADSVARHCRSDVPYGLFLSGGVDSAAVLALMRETAREPVLAFSAGFAGAARDERAHARAVATAAGARFEPIAVEAADLWRELPAIAEAMDDPAADYAVLPTYLLARLARERGVKVVLTGEGGDELFAGYGRYRRAVRWRILGGRRMRARSALAGLGLLRREDAGWRDGIAAAEAAETRAERSRLQVLQAVDCADWLPNDLLTKLDRCLMAFGVEGRTPLVDVGVAEVAFRLPDRLKTRGRLGKWALRQLVDKRLPQARPFEAKRGFTVPVGSWIAAEGARLGPLVAAQTGVAEVCRPEAVAGVFRADDSHARQAAWILLFYALWHRRHILGRPAAGDVFATLSEAA